MKEHKRGFWDYCNIHVDERKLRLYKRLTLPNGSRTFKALDIGQICTICFIGVWNAMEEKIQ